MVEEHQKTPPLSLLLERARSGDQESFRRLTDLSTPRLLTWIHLRLGPALRQRYTVEDVLQETLLRAFQGLSAFEWRSEAAFHRWLGGIAEHVIQDCFRKTFRTAKRDAGTMLPLSPEHEGTVYPGNLGDRLERVSASPSRVLLRHERLERLEKALAALAPDRREAVMLSIINELPLDEVAARMGRSREAVSMLVWRALGQLRAVFGTTDSFHLPDRPLRADSHPGAAS